MVARNDAASRIRAALDTHLQAVADANVALRAEVAAILSVHGSALDIDDGCVVRNAPARAAPAPAPHRNGGAKPKPAAATTVGGVPTTVPPTARAAYLEGVEAKKGGQGRDLNPYDGIRGIPVARRKAWFAAWDAS